MKRSSHEVAGGPRLRNLPRAVAGRPAPSAGVDVFTTRPALRRDPIAIAAEEAEVLADFAEFMNAEDDFESGPLPPPDQTFKERLRRRLWRTFVMGFLRGGGDSTH
jgi:hypothetical protein